MNFSKVQEPIVSTGCDVRRLFIIPWFHRRTKDLDDAQASTLCVSDRDELRERELLQHTHTHTHIQWTCQANLILSERARVY